MSAVREFGPLGPPPHFVASEAEVVDAFLLGGWRKEVAEGKVEPARAEVRALLDRLCGAGLPVRIGEGGERFFDPVTLRLICTRGLEGKDPFLWERVTVPKRINALRFAPKTPPSERFHDPRHVSVTLRRELFFPDRAPGSRVIVSTRVPVDEPTQRNVVVTPEESPGIQVSVADGMLVARARVPEEGGVKIGARFDFIGYQQTVKVDPALLEVGAPVDPSLTRYLSRSEGIIRISPYVETLAARLKRSTPWDTLLAFWDHFFDERKLGGFYQYLLDPEDPLGSVGEWVDCYLGSALFVGVARACGIPARLVQGGILYPGTDIGVHYWAEAFLPPYGWVPFDLHSWNLAFADKTNREWSHFLFGHLPYQLVLDRLPRDRLELGAAYPPRWYSLARIEGAGQEHSVINLDTGAPVLREYFEASIGDVA